APVAATHRSPSLNEGGQLRPGFGASLEISTCLTATVTSPVGFQVTASSAARSNATDPAVSLMVPVNAGVSVSPVAGVKVGGLVVSSTVNEKSLGPLTVPEMSTVTAVSCGPIAA